MAFRVGQKVVCVDAHSPGQLFGTFWRSGEEITKGHIYTIARIWTDLWGGAVFDLRERRREPIMGLPCGYGVFRFRPVVERKTDISIFKALLNPANHKRLEDVS